MAEALRCQLCSGAGLQHLAALKELRERGSPAPLEQQSGQSTSFTSHLAQTDGLVGL